MGLFSKLRNANKPAATQSDEIARGVLSVPILMAAADGSIDEVEMLQIQNMCAFNPIFLSIGAAKTLELCQDIVNQLKAQGAESVFERVLKALPEPQRETALCFAVRAALADGYLDEREKEMLINMGSRMGMPPEKFQQIFEVVAMMQRPAAA